MKLGRTILSIILVLLLMSFGVDKGTLLYNSKPFHPKEHKPITKFKKGDVIFSFDSYWNKTTIGEIIDMKKVKVLDYVKIKVLGEYYIVDNDIEFRLGKEWVPVKKVQVGDTIKTTVLTEIGVVEEITFEKSKRPKKFYKLRTNKDNAYLLGENGLVVRDNW